MIKSNWEENFDTADKKQLEMRKRFQRAANKKQILIEKYIRQITPFINDEMAKLRVFANNNNIPIIQPETERFLSQIVNFKNPKKILEIGTAIGYSALVFAYSMKCGHIDTIEKSEEMVRLAKQNIKLAPKEVIINIILGNGIDEIDKLYDNNFDDNKYDLVFIDAAKGQYMTFLKAVLPLVKNGGIIISDNIFYGGLIARDRYDVPRRQRTIHKRMREYLEYLMTQQVFDTSLLNIGDGIALTIYGDQNEDK